uniref:Signal peptidase complex subunit 1 n=1 Tax=Peronospora matthiolae TaxID=2874970 RepID=A0AAV1TET1_9STRA
MVDYKGQARAEILLVVCYVVICTPAWIHGYFKQDFTSALHAWMVATVVSALLILPNWPIYNRHPVKWLPSAMYVKKKSS